MSDGVMHAMLGILGALCEADDRWVSYSRRWEWYVGQQRSYGPYFSYTNIVGAVDALDHHDCIEHRRARPGTTSKWQSSVRATPALLALLHDPSTIYRTDPAPLIIVRDSDKRAIDVPNTREVAAMGRKLAALREAEDCIRLELNSPSVAHARHVIVNGNKVPNLSSPSLTRIFSRGSTRYNGRRHASGGGYQNLPSKYRHQLSINGEPVGIADFRAMHVHMLYAQTGAQLEGDPYTDFDGLSRDEAKVALLVAINARTRQSAVGAIRSHVPNFSHKEAARAYDAVAARHAPISRSFGSDAGIRLMRQESDIQIDAAVECTRLGIPVLGVHDEIMAPSQCIEQVAEIMRAASYQKLGREVPVRVTAKGGAQ